MANFRLRAELFPNFHRSVPRLRDVFRYIGLLVAKSLCPPMFMLLANAIAIRIVVIHTEIQCINPPDGSMDQGVTQGAGDRIVATDHEQRITGLRCDRRSKLASGRMVFVIPPGQVLGDFLGVVGKDAFKLLLGDSHSELPST